MMLSFNRMALVAQILSLAAITAAPPLHGQDTANSFFDTVEVEVVNVEVFVTDKDGNPVTGLTADDFEVFHDRQQVPISNFYTATGAAPTDETALAPIEATDAQAETETIPAEQRLNLVIFIDNQNIAPKNRNRVIEALRGSLFFSLRPEDRVTLVSYDGSLRIRQGLTGDPRNLAEELDKIAEGGATGVFSSLDRISILRELQQTDLQRDVDSLAPTQFGFATEDAGADWGSILQRIRTYAQAEFARTVSTIQTLDHLISSLSALEGRKALIYVSDGLSLRPGEALFQAFARKAPPEESPNSDFESREYDTTRLFEQLGKSANASRVTFYTILAAGSSNQSQTAAEQSAFFDPGASAATLGQVWDAGLETLERSNFRGSMQILAESTGGLATLSSYNFGGALRRVQQDLGTFYSLGYEAPGQDFEDHKIKVVVKRDDLKIRHRESYRLRSTDEEMEVRTQSALIFEESGNPLGVITEFGEPKKGEKGYYLVPVIVKFPLNKLVLAPGERTHDGQVSIYVGARSIKNGNLSPVQRMPAPVTIPNDKLMTALGQVAGYRMMLQIRDGEHSVAVSVRDEVAHVESTTIATFDPSKVLAAAPAVTANAD